MRFNSLQTATSALLIGSALAQPLQQHQHNLHKRDVVYVTETIVQVITLNGQTTTLPYYDLPSTTLSSSLSSATRSAEYIPNQQSVEDSWSSSSQDDETETYAAPSTTSVAPTTFTTSTAQAVESETEASSSSSAATSSSSSSGSLPSSSAGFAAKGITYSPYTANGGCKSASQVASDLAQLTDFGIIRIYGVDCNQVENVLAAKQSSQKVFAGIFDVSNIQSGIQTIADAVKSQGSWDDIYTVSIGNELVNDGEATVSQIGQYVEAGKSALTAAGYTGPVVSVDTFIAVINNPGLCDLSDYIAVNGHAYFDGYVTAENAGDWVVQQIERVWTACGGKKDVLITETGWPSQGNTNGVAVASKSSQTAAVDSIKSKCSDSSFLFNAYNDQWKQPGSYGVEQYWGIF